MRRNFLKALLVILPAVMIMAFNNAMAAEPVKVVSQQDLNWPDFSVGAT